jgi:hypothetical protein
LQQDGRMSNVELAEKIGYESSIESIGKWWAQR